MQRVQATVDRTSVALTRNSEPAPSPRRRTKGGARKKRRRKDKRTEQGGDENGEKN